MSARRRGCGGRLPGLKGNRGRASASPRSAPKARPTRPSTPSPPQRDSYPTTTRTLSRCVDCRGLGSSSSTTQTSQVMSPELEEHLGGCWMPAMEAGAGAGGRTQQARSVDRVVTARAGATGMKPSASRGAARAHTISWRPVGRRREIG